MKNRTGTKRRQVLCFVWNCQYLCFFNIAYCVGCTWGAGLGSGGGLLSMAGHHRTLQWRGYISREEDGGVVRPESVLSGEMNEGAEVKLHAVRVDIAHIMLHIHTDRQHSNKTTFSTTRSFCVVPAECTGSAQVPSQQSLHWLWIMYVNN